MYSYNPIIVTQVLNKQIAYLTDTPVPYDLTNEIWGKYVNKRLESSVVRLYQYKSDIHLEYFWYSTLKEPFSGRSGLITVLDVSCSIKEFKNNRELLAEKLQSLLSSIVNTICVNNIECSDEFMQRIWNLAKGIGSHKYSEYYNMEDIYKLVELIIFRADNTVCDYIDEQLLEFVNSQKISLFKKVDEYIPLTISTPQNRLKM